MQQRKSTFGRPTGTDGSDFSYRMVVESRYQRVAEGKSRFSKLIFVQAIIQIIGALYAVLRTSWEGGPNRIAISSTAVCLISLFIGDLGRRRSRANLLRFYMVASSIALIVSIYCVAKDNLTLQVLQDLSNWERHKFELLEISHAILGFLIQIFSVCTVVSLIQNMSPPKKAS